MSSDRQRSLAAIERRSVAVLDDFHVGVTQKFGLYFNAHNTKISHELCEALVYFFQFSIP